MLKFADTAEAMGNFPVALANGIEITKKDNTKKSLQAMYDDGELGGGEGLPLPEQANMVMITYEKEDGDLDWKQSLLKTVEKVDEMPTTFEDKVYVHSGGTQVKEELLTLNPMIYSTTFPTEKFEEDIAKIDAICDKFGVTYTITEEGTNVRNVNFSYDGLFTLSKPEYYVDMPIKYLEFTRVNTAEWYWILHIGTKRVYTKELNDKVYLVYKEETESQVYASDVELATKEYADTHGAGAQVYTKAEWDALPVKPAPGTQVIISDDTSGGGGGGTVTESKLKAIKLKNNYYVATADTWTNVTLSQSIDGFGALGFSVSPSDVGMECASQTMLPVDYFKLSSKTNPVVINFNAANDTTTYKFMVYYVDDTTVAVYRGSNVYQYHRFNMMGLTGGITGGTSESTDQYSTEETKTNKVWIDGKPIYRKVISGFTYGAENISVNTGISNIATIIDLRFIESGVTGTYADFIYNGTNRASSNLRINKNTGVVTTDGRSTSVVGNNGIIIIEYTKTID